MEESKRNDRGAETARVRLEIKRVEKYSVYSVELSRGSSGIQRDGIFTGRRPHAYETTAVAKAGPAMRLIRRCFVIVVGKFRLARRRVHADRVADQNYTLAALAQLRAFRLVLAIQLQRSSKPLFPTFSLGKHTASSLPLLR